MLDEPTNHLDLNATAWLEETLKKYRGTVLLISHDRYFLNAVCDAVAELSMTRLTQYEGNYDQFWSSERSPRPPAEGIRDANGRDRPTGGDH
jgi:ATP-binding cassette subfamily F protein 3